MRKRLGVRETVVDGAIVPGDLAVEDGRVAAVGTLPPGARGTGLPGFVDLQLNGFAGVDLVAADEQGYLRVGESLAATGVTAYQATFVSSPLERYRKAFAVIGQLPPLPGAQLVGVHLEGPFISPLWTGAQNPEHVRAVDVDLAMRLCDEGPVTCMTVAPELPGALDLVAALAGRAVVVSLGHSDAGASTAHAAFDRGARAVTHIYNAQRRWRARDPGLAGAALVRPEVTVQAIVDLVHLAPESVYAAFLAARQRFAIVTDAIMAAQRPDGRYRLGDTEVTVANGVARTEEGALAGSVTTMDRMVANLVSLSAPLPDASAAASGVPARLLGRSDLGAIFPGAPADVAVLDDSLEVTRTLVGGIEAFGR
jgi:N-acetylglucosamine-6-phosphate deacetylase